MIYSEKLIFSSFLLIALILGIDIYHDSQNLEDLTHVIYEAIAFVVSFGMLATFFLRYAKDSLTKNQQIERNIKKLTEERDAWRQKSYQHINGLSQAIDSQFENWNLTESEKEIGLLLLKGLAHNEIADIRNTSERTVRQQAAAIYLKAGVENKAQLSAFFLEDLMLPLK